MRTSIEKALSEFKKHNIPNKNFIVVVDFTLPSHQKRLFVVDTHSKKILRSHHVAHGSKSNCIYDRAHACYFSNKIGSRKSSLGAMVTGKIYTWGKKFPTKNKLKLHGLEPQNKNVFARAIVVHSSNYVTDGYIATHGRAGNSWGCFAIDPAIANELIHMIADGTFLYSYY